MFKNERFLIIFIGALCLQTLAYFTGRFESVIFWLATPFLLWLSYQKIRKLIQNLSAHPRPDEASWRMNSTPRQSRRGIWASGEPRSVGSADDIPDSFIPRGKPRGFRSCGIKIQNFLNLPTLIFWASLISLIITAFLVATDRSISTPWQTWWWPLFTLEFLTIFISGYLWQKNIPGARPFFIGTLLALPALLASIVYKIGYGFDPFIHEATIEHILNFGFISPKTPYYLGQYFSILWLHQILPLPVHLLGKIIWPIFLFIFLFLAPKIWRDKLIWLPALWFFLSPVLTPYNLALLLALLAILWMKENPLRPRGLLLSALIVLIHPLVGLPLMGFALAEKFLKNIWQKLGLIGSALAVPVAFKLANFVTAQKFIEIKTITLARWQDFLTLLSPKTFQLDNLLEVATVLSWALPLLFIFFGYWHRRKEKMTADQIMALSLFAVGALLMLFARFPQVFANNQYDYPLRLWTLGLLFILPEALARLNQLSLWQKNWRPAVLLILLLALMIFNIFPRYDRYQKDRLFSVSQADLTAQATARAGAGQNKFAILTNQMTAVAGLWQYGFEATPKKPLLYSLPTNDETYAAYLHFVNLDNYSSKAEIKKAATAFGVTTVFIIVPSYWNKFGQLGVKASREAQKIIWLENNSAFIAKYQF